MAITNLGKVVTTHRGEYSPSVQYTRLDIVSYLGSSYMVLKDTVGVTPVVGANYQLVAEAGTSTAITNLTVSTGAPGTAATVTPGGTALQRTYALTVPRGDKGVDGSFTQKAYTTEALMIADKAEIPTNTSVMVTNDTAPSKNGLYAYNGTTFTKSGYDPLAQANTYTDNKVKGVTNNFKTKALMTASALPNDSYAMVTDETVNNGPYVKTAGVWVKSDYDPLTLAKADATTKAKLARIGAVEDIFTQGSVPTAIFKTKALMVASSLTIGQYANVTEDAVESNNGLYIKTLLEFKKTSVLDGLSIGFPRISPDYERTTLTNYQSQAGSGYIYADLHVHFKAGEDVKISVYNSFGKGETLVFYKLTATGVQELHRQTFVKPTGVHTYSLSDISYDFSAVTGFIFVGLLANDLTYCFFAKPVEQGVASTTKRNEAIAWLPSTPQTILKSANKLSYWIERRAPNRNSRMLLDDVWHETKIANHSVIEVLLGNGLFKAETYTVESALTPFVQNNMNYKGVKGLTKILYTGAGTLFDLKNGQNIVFEDIIFDGNNNILPTAITPDEIKSLSVIGDKHGFNITGITTENIQFINCRFINWSGWGIKSSGTHLEYVNTMKLSGNVFRNNGGGIYFGTRSEYNQLIQNSFSYNKIGCFIGGGNNSGSANHFNRNGVGIILTDEGMANGTHGTLSACQINHNLSYSIYSYGMLNGFTFSGSHVYEGNIVLDNSRGFNFNGGVVSANVVTENENAGSNIIANNIFDGGAILGAPTKLSLKGNSYLNGADSSSINN